MMDLEGIMVSDGRERQIAYNLFYMLNKKNPELIDAVNRSVVARDGRLGVGQNE